jgi:hypothetical protein
MGHCHLDSYGGGQDPQAVQNYSEQLCTMIKKWTKGREARFSTREKAASVRCYGTSHWSRLFSEKSSPGLSPRLRRRLGFVCQT